MNPSDLSNILNNVLNAIYAALGIFTVLGGVVVWLLSQRFLSKKSFGEVLSRKEGEMDVIEKRIIALEKQHEVAAGPIKNLQTGVDDIKLQMTELTKTMNSMNVRLALLDQAEKDRKSHRRGGHQE
jgi:chromosome segregation ATPase